MVFPAFPFPGLQAATARGLELVALRQSALSAMPGCPHVSLARPACGAWFDDGTLPKPLFYTDALVMGMMHDDEDAPSNTCLSERTLPVYLLNTWSGDSADGALQYSLHVWRSQLCGARASRRLYAWRCARSCHAVARHLVYFFVKVLVRDVDVAELPTFVFATLGIHSMRKNSQ